MEMILNNNFITMTNDEKNQINGGGFVAAVYALGFVMGMSPLGALCLCGVCVAGGITAGIIASR